MMDGRMTPPITTIPFEKLGGGIFRISEMRHPLAILTLLRYVG